MFTTTSIAFTASIAVISTNVAARMLVDLKQTKLLVTVASKDWSRATFALRSLFIETARSIAAASANWLVLAIMNWISFDL